MSKKKFVIGTVCCVGVLSIGLGCTNYYNIKQEKQEQIRIEKIKKEKEQERIRKEKEQERIKKEKEQERIKKEKEQERIAREKEEKEKEELRRKQEEEEKRKAEELKAAQEAERLTAEQAAQQAIAEENNVQENCVAEETVQNNEYAVAANTQTSVTYEDFMVMGVVYSNGYKYTYYSQSV